MRGERTRDRTKVLECLMLYSQMGSSPGACGGGGMDESPAASSGKPQCGGGTPSPHFTILSPCLLEGRGVQLTPNPRAVAVPAAGPHGSGLPVGSVLGL